MITVITIDNRGTVMMELFDRATVDKRLSEGRYKFHTVRSLFADDYLNLGILRNAVYFIDGGPVMPINDETGIRLG